MRLFYNIGLSPILLLASVSTLAAQAAPKTLPEPDVVSTIQDIVNSNLLKLSQPLVIDKVYNFSGWFIVTDRIIFKSGAQLVFSQQALANRRNFFIVAKEIVSEDANAPGLITYEKPQPAVASATPGQAQSGPAGTSDGASGSQGIPGAKGIEGSKGFSAPAITITVLSIPGSGPMIDFTGGIGGQGGQGQKGGDGGAGHQGSPASQSMVDCKAGGGRGGNGGNGGTGGEAGNGGPGGDGGSVKIIAPSDILPSISEKVRVLVSGGNGGPVGKPGEGGVPGSAGSGGQEAKPYCGGGDGGGGGSVGATGSAGQPGNPGLAGDFFVGSISTDQFAKIDK